MTVAELKTRLDNFGDHVNVLLMVDPKGGYADVGDIDTKEVVDSDGGRQVALVIEPE